MTTYYVSASGSDSNPGTDPSTPWATIQKVNSALSGGTIIRGDTVRYRRGDEFFGKISAIPTSTATSGPRLTIGAYGAGARPRISGYKVANQASGWTQHATGVWKIDLTNAASFTGNPATTVNTGFLLVDKAIKGVKKWALADLSAPWDFYNDTQYLYVKASDNPTFLGADIRVAVDGTLVTGQNAVLISNLELVGSGAHGYRQSGNVGYTELVGCFIHECGGAQLGTSGTTRYGNGAEIWIGSYDTLVHHNEFADIYDVACTLQGPQNGMAIGWQRCHFRFNRIWNCTQAFEQWATGTDTTSAGSGLVACSFTDNVCINMGRSWSYPVRSDQVGKGNALMTYSQDLPIDLTVKRNVFFDPRDCYFFVNTNGNKVKPGYVSDDNVIALRPGTLIQAQTAQTIENVADWVAATGLEKNSQWITIPATISSVDAAMTFLAGHAGLSAQQHKITERANAIARADNSARIEEAYNNLSALAPSSITTLQRTTSPVTYAKLLTVTLTNDSSRYDGHFDYTTQGDGLLGHRESGRLTVRFVAPQGGGSTYVRLDVAELVPFTIGSTRFQRSDFIAVLELDDATNHVYTVSLWLRMSDDFTIMRLVPVSSVVSGPGSCTFTSQSTLAAALSSGTQITPSVDPSWIPRPTTGTTAPAFVPTFIGQKYVDTTAKRTYSAVGTSSPSDWEYIPAASGLVYGRPSPLASGLYYTAQATTVSAGTPGGANGVMTGYRLIAGRTCTLSNLALEVTTAGSAGAVVRLMVYGLTLGSTPTATLLVDAGTIDATVTGIKTLPISLPVNAGDMLYVGAAIQGAAATLPAIRTSDGMDPDLGATPATLSNTRLLGLQATGISGPAPASQSLSVQGSPARVMVSAA